MLHKQVSFNAIGGIPRTIPLTKTLQEWTMHQLKMNILGCVLSVVEGFCFLLIFLPFRD